MVGRLLSSRFTSFPDILWLSPLPFLCGGFRQFQAMWPFLPHWKQVAWLMAPDPLATIGFTRTSPLLHEEHVTRVT